MNLVVKYSPNRGGALVDYRYIVLHHTSSWNEGAGTADFLCTPEAQVSANFLVGKTGIVYQLVEPGIVAWHAGKGSGFGVPDNCMNQYSVGIEIANAGNGSDPYPEVQLDALDELIAYLDNAMGKQIPIIIDHKAWAPGRKDDMSANFPLDAYEQYRCHSSYQLAILRDSVPLRAWCRNLTDAQKFRTLEVGDGFVKIQSIARLDLVADAKNGSTEDRTDIQAYVDNGTDAQSWKLIPVPYAYGNLYKIASKLDENKVWDMRNGSVETGAALQLYHDNGTDAQLFFLVPAIGDYGYYIVSKKSLLPIDLENAGN